MHTDSSVLGFISEKENQCGRVELQLIECLLESMTVNGDIRNAISCHKKTESVEEQYRRVISLAGYFAGKGKLGR